MKNLQQKKIRHKSTPIKQLISITVARYSAATSRERQSILNFFDWLIQNTRCGELQNFHVEIKSRLEMGGAK